MEARRERPVYDKFVIDDDMGSDTVTEFNLSLRSRSFLNRVNDRLRKILDQISYQKQLDPQDVGSLVINCFEEDGDEGNILEGVPHTHS